MSEQEKARIRLEQLEYGALAVLQKAKERGAPPSVIVELERAIDYLREKSQ